ncbi:hypothetical protein K1719_021100 [Acacia pycnantha]|nr:hypothetical protein K1719_021100 [Acacia pycnantha]
MDNMNNVWVISSLLLCFTVGGLAEQCGTQAGGALCPGGLCCSKHGWCGSTYDYCGPGCQSQCPPPSPPPPPPAPPGPPPPEPSGGLADIISRDTFEQMLMHRDDARCPATGFYTYDAFIQAAKSFLAFATTGDADTRKREAAAFLAQTSHETTGGWPDAPGGPYAWGYCFKEEVARGDYCAPSEEYPCAPGKQYYGRGPIQLSWNYNYGQAGTALKEDLLNNPDLVATDPLLSFETALWFWMTPQSPKPSCHDVMTGSWTPSDADVAAGRLPGYGTVTNIINGGLECGIGPDPRVEDRIGFYKRYCDILGVDYGDNLDCNSQRPFGSSSLIDVI